MQSESSSNSSSSLYVRQSSGLVREASVIDAIIFNAVFSAPVLAIILASVIVAGILAWSVLSSSFATLLSMGVLAGVVTILCVSVAALAFPFRRPDLYRSSPASATIAGIPVLPVVAVLSIAVMIGLAYIVLSYPQLGL